MTAGGWRSVCALLAGALFGTGLLVGGMTAPRKVLGFLDIFGAWDASLVFVMGAAVVVHAIAVRLIRGRAAPLFAAAFELPTRSAIDAQLLVGASVFGVGWGLSGFCPGPAVVALAGFGAGTWVFVLGMLAGLLVTGKIERARERERQSLPGALSGP